MNYFFLIIIIISTVGCAMPQSKKSNNYEFIFKNSFSRNSVSIRREFQERGEYEKFHKKEKKITKVKIKEENRGEILNNSFIWPLKDIHITSNYGKRKDPLNKKKMKFHHGIDISAKLGTDVKASRGGKVIFAQKNGGYGLTVMILHENNIISLYAHLSEILVKKGVVVKQGIIIGKVGSTGRSTGPHLHFEVRKNNKSVNPIYYLKSNKT